MKKWTNPEIETLNLEFTEKGTAKSDFTDATWVDDNGNRWWSYSGESADSDTI